MRKICGGSGGRASDFERGVVGAAEYLAAERERGELDRNHLGNRSTVESGCIQGYSNGWDHSSALRYLFTSKFNTISKPVENKIDIIARNGNTYTVSHNYNTAL